MNGRFSRSDFNLRGELKRGIDFDPKIAERALRLGMAEQQLQATLRPLLATNIKTVQSPPSA